jgi:hypothetical protein
VVEDVTRLGCRNWTIVALNWEGWRKLLKESEPTPGCSAVGEREIRPKREISLIRNKRG